MADNPSPHPRANGTAGTDGDSGRGSTRVNPLAAGIVLATIGATAAVASTFFIADAHVGVLAAIILSFGCVGVAAGLVLTRRKSWADSTWPPDTQTRPWTARRTRRITLVYGGFLALTAFGGAVGLLRPDQRELDDVVRGWVLVGVLAAAGLGLVMAGSRRAPSAVRSSDRPANAPAGDDEWTPLGPPRPRRLFAWWAVPLAFSGQPFLIPMLFAAFFPLLTFRLGTWTWIVTAGALVVAVVVGISVLRRRSRPPLVARDGSRMLVGKEEIPTAEVVTAMVMASRWEPDATGRSVAVVLTTRGKARALIQLRERGHLALTEDQTRLLAMAIAQSGIELPRDKEDPRGRFSRSLYPNYLTKPEAMQFVEQPPGDGEALPVGPPPA